MRPGVFERLQPICPRCLEADKTAHTLLIQTVARSGGSGDDEYIDQGLLQCGHCGLEFPVIDGVPIIVPNVREYVAAYARQIMQRTDLAEHLESLIGDCLGPEDGYNLDRYYLSSFAYDGYGQLSDDGFGIAPLTQNVLEHANPSKPEPWLDVGCGVGRSSFELAQWCSGFVLGVDTNFSMVRLARHIQTGKVDAFASRELGLVYEQARVKQEFVSPDTEFWVCDAQRLPFRAETFGDVLALNVLDAVSSPMELLRETGRVLADQGTGVFATPFDWSSQVTPLQNWIGGHSQRGSTGGDPINVLNEIFPLAIESGQLDLEVLPIAPEWDTTRSSRSVTRYKESVFKVTRRTV